MGTTLATCRFIVDMTAIVRAGSAPTAGQSRLPSLLDRQFVEENGLDLVADVGATETAVAPSRPRWSEVPISQRGPRRVWDLDWGVGCRA